jgi:hypothetical protein
MRYVNTRETQKEDGKTLSDLLYFLFFLFFF